MQVVDRLAGDTEPSNVRTALGSAAAVVAQIVPMVDSLVPGLEAPPPLDAEAARFRLYGAVAGFLCRLAEHRPLVVVLDDLHWADVPSLQLLSFLAAHITNASILVVATYREVDPVVGPPLSDTLAELAREPVTSRLFLSGLEPDDVARYMAGVSTVEPSSALVAQVHGRTEGNPFFVGELVRLLESEAGNGTSGGPMLEAIGRAAWTIVTDRPTCWRGVSIAAVAVMTPPIPKLSPTIARDTTSQARSGAQAASSREAAITR